MKGKRRSGTEPGGFEVDYYVRKTTLGRLDRLDEHREPGPDHLADKSPIDYLELSPAERIDRFDERVMHDPDHVGSCLPNPHVGERRAGRDGAVLRHGTCDGGGRDSTGKLAGEKPNCLLFGRW